MSPVQLLVQPEVILALILAIIIAFVLALNPPDDRSRH